MNKRPTLKVCPFCGSKAVYGRSGAEWMPDDRRGWYARCVFGCATSPDQDSKDKARDWWNRRHKGPQFAK